MIYLRLFLEFLKVGLFTFGGAYGSIPIIRETVLGNGWMDDDLFTYILGVSESTPGPIMVNTATYVGNTVGTDAGGVWGGLLGAFCAEFFLENQGTWESFKSSIGAFLGFLCGTGLKLICSGLMFYYVIVYL